jgi:hypothetical protein
VARLSPWHFAPIGMGRKAAPQPLSLAETTRPSDNSPRLGETVPRSARLPSDPTSPRSPRSPFRYGQNKVEIASIGEPQPLADVLHQPRQSLEHQEEQRPPRQRNPDDARDPPQPQPSPRDQAADQQQQQQQQLGHRHTRRGDDKSSKSGFFFNFGKGAKSDRPIVHQHSNSRAEVMSRDSDRPALSKQSTKHSGMYANILCPIFHGRLDFPDPVDPTLKPASPPWGRLLFQVTLTSLLHHRLAPSGPPFGPKVEHTTAFQIRSIASLDGRLREHG